ncbi:MAG: hypothetical protein JOS17DRAFT_779872 [Linnemannia elongata]|nr:MAG: hypothetical protein JOS17DRAFT_779872 [Linnemannia elongata]
MKLLLILLLLLFSFYYCYFGGEALVPTTRAVWGFSYFGAKMEAIFLSPSTHWDRIDESHSSYASYVFNGEWQRKKEIDYFSSQPTSTCQTTPWYLSVPVS